MIDTTIYERLMSAKLSLSMGVSFKPIWGMPHIGFFGKFHRRCTAMGGVRPVVVVVMLLYRQYGPRMAHRGEQRLIEAFFYAHIQKTCVSIARFVYFD